MNSQNFASSDAASFDASPFDVTLSFADTEIGEHQRWSTWPAITPSERGPLPWPDWVVTSAAAVDTELGILKTGKEADVFLIERAVIDLPQIVDTVANPQGLDLLHRDCVNICDWFTRQRVDCDAEELFADLMVSAFG